MTDNIKSTPLVSVVVITYNSSKYVLETLESIKSQTYVNIELVVSDDCSRDETITLVQDWLDTHRSRFTDCKLLVAAQNKGIPGNCNQGLQAASGEWVKYIAGDDYLLPGCISTFINAVQQNSRCSCFVSDMYVIHNGVINTIYQVLPYHFPANAGIQLDNFIRYKSIPGPALFFKRETLTTIGGFDERYPGLEDYPLYIRLTLAGYWFHVINKPTVIYRIHGESITQTPGSFFTNSYNAHFNDVIKPLIVERKLHGLKWHYWLQDQLATASGLPRVLFSWLVRTSDFYYWQKKWMSLRQMSPHAQIKTLGIKPMNLSEVLTKPL